MKKVISILLATALTASMLAGCGGKNETPETQAPETQAPAESGDQGGDAAEPAVGGTIKVAAIETAYGSSMWQEVCDAFTEETGIAVELITDKNLEDVIGSAMKAGDFPDVIHLATGREDALTETFIKDQNIVEITDVLSMTVPGEDKKVSDKIAGGFTETARPILPPCSILPADCSTMRDCLRKRDGPCPQPGMRCGNWATRPRQREFPCLHIRQPVILTHFSML